jgi:hypothetical protein
MRGALLLFGLAVLLIGAGVFISLPTAPATKRLAGVTVRLVSSRVVVATDGRHQLWADVLVESQQPIGECLHFALDEPFANRALDAPTLPGGCVRPDSVATRYTLRMAQLDQMDTQIPDHELLWGAGGGCGWIMGLLGTCSVDTVGMLKLVFPVPSLVPTLRPGATFGAIMPLPTFDVSQFNSWP